MMLKRVLIANRGEIAARVARTCARLGVEFVCVYSEADAKAPYLDAAFSTVSLGAAQATASYLNQDKLIAAALNAGCDSIHPGYGFLSENFEFAKAVKKAGLIFVGPEPETIEALGDKVRAKTLMRKAQVTTVPGTLEATEDPERIAVLANEIGYPLLLKPTAGGGGKGMQIVYEQSDLFDAVKQGVRLARANFSDGRLLVERYIENPRHIEVQIFGDGLGNVVHLYERECSLQRRHQKVIEEAPAASLVPQMREALLSAAVRGAKAVNYCNAGTFEFIVSESGEFFFLEVNTRLQVEHPVSEEVTGLDFVEWQLKIAAGQGLPLRQEHISCTGHAIECRVYAEDPTLDFQPTPGTITALVWSDDVRVETGIEVLGEVSPYYDPMIAKLVVHSENRAKAIDSALRALERSAVIGVTTNLGFLTQILCDPAVRANAIHTRYLDQKLDRFNGQLVLGPALACAGALALFVRNREQASEASGPWQTGSASGALYGRHDLSSNGRLGYCTVWHQGDAYDVALHALQTPNHFAISLDGEQHRVEVTDLGAQLYRGVVNGKSWFALAGSEQIDLVLAGRRVLLQPYEAKNPASQDTQQTGAALMPGVLVALHVQPGDQVVAGMVLAVVEAMKMENKLLAEEDGVVTVVHCALGDSVRAGQLIVSIEAAK